MCITYYSDSKKKIVEYLRREEGEAAYTTRSIQQNIIIIGIWYMYNDWSQLIKRLVLLCR